MKNNLVINIVGDICLKDIEDDNYFFSDEVKDIFSKGDVNLANLECALTYSEAKLNYQPIHLKGDPKMNDVIRIFDVYSIANNHVMDFKTQGLFDTINFLEDNSKNYFGAGKNKHDALKPLLIERNGIKLAFFGFTRYNTATKKKAGTAPEDFKYLCSEIKKVKNSNYFVIVYPHWNYQWIEYPAPDERKKGKKLIDAGADIVIGAHPHIVQGYEIYKGKYIYHSLGNFIFKNTKYSKQIPQFGQSFILTVTIDKTLNYTTKITSVFNNNEGVRLMSSDENILFVDYFERISSEIKNNKEARKLFYRSANKVEKNNQFVFGELKKDGGYKAILANYKIANIQDIKRRGYAILFKIFNR